VSGEAKQSSSIVAIFREFLTRYPRRFGFLFALLVVEGAAAGMSVLAVVPMADFLLDPTLARPSRVTQTVDRGLAALGFPPSFWLFGLLFVSFTMLNGALDVAVRYAILRIKYAVVRGIVADAMRTFFKARWEFFSGSAQSRLLNTMNKELNTIGDTLGHLANMLAQVVQICMYLAVPLCINASVTLAALGLSMALGVPFLFLNRVSYRLGKENTETANVLMGVLSEVLGAARLVLGFGRQVEARERYLTAFDRHVAVTLRSQTLASAVPNLFKPLAMLAVVIAMTLSIHQKMHVSELAAVMWSLLASMPILAALLQGRVSLANFLPSYVQLIALQETANGLVEVEGDRRFEVLDRGVELRDVSFTYPGRTETLTRVTLDIPKGKMTALVGESGSGKSTVTDLVLGLQVPQAGEVLVDGVSLALYQQNSFRERIGYVPQDPLLFHASIRDNLLWSFDRATEADLWSALALANAEKFVRELPDGLETVVGDRGIRLSGGQRQRIALARALLRTPDLLILDEATSSLDSESEQLIQASIDQLAQSTTILVVAHRLSTIARADHVYVLRHGRVIEEGTFAALTAKPESVLRGMIAAQRPMEIALAEEAAS
jgi:ABC-type multidrug transport system fused ATPase/permease subunit